MYYSDEFKEQLKNSVSVLDVIRATGHTLYDTGNGYSMNCPFHEETNPSFHIHPEKNYFHCFSCGAGSRFHDSVRVGDIYSFVMGHYKYNLYEAIQWISQTFSIYPPNEEESQETSLRRQSKAWWNNLTQENSVRFQNNLQQNEEAYWYLRGRGFSNLDIHNWELGVGDDVQIEFIHSKNKITFPIKDYDGNIISFIARVPLNKEELFELNEKEKLDKKRVTPKYEHRWKLKPSDVNQIYYDNHPHKSFERKHYLYGIYEAKEAIRRMGVAIITEGFTDVITLHKHGITNTVSTMGLRLTDEHINLLKKAGAQKIILMRDADISGIKAAESDAQLLKSYNIETWVCPLPDGEDPDSLGQKYSISKDEYARYIRNSTTSIPRWKVELVYKRGMNDIFSYNNRIHEIRTNQLTDLVNTLKEEEDLIERDLMMNQYAQLFNISVDTMRNYVNQEG